MSQPAATIPSQRFTLRDVVFAAMTSAAIMVVGFITIPLVGHIPIPGIRSMVSAPFSAVFLTIALARIGKAGSMSMVYALNCVVYALISPVIPAFVVSALVLVEGMNFIVFRGYRTPLARLICVSGFYTVMTPLGTLWGAWILGGQYQRFISSLPMLALSTFIVFALSFSGAYVGERVVDQLRRAGKLA
ncbi:hypothetical protein [Salidesulfovibrio brasiliensis]|uniref:hypothetical protein n=1 Tax=Salidesulfovibrio brasiliensis TaxID=221711 RepID=UPI0006D10058|nr:hypothetical protein [Salidesulfovibrio brasiliensis]